MTTEPFDEFLATTRPEAAAAYVTGDATPITSISTPHDPATFFGPAGGSVTGAKSVIETNQTGAATFEPGGETRLEVLHAGHDGNLAYWVGFQHATVHMAGGDEASPRPPITPPRSVHRRRGRCVTPSSARRSCGCGRRTSPSMAPTRCGHHLNHETASGWLVAPWSG